MESTNRLANGLTANTVDYFALPVSELRTKAEAGDSEAQFRLGWMYRWLTGSQDLAEAAKWYRKAADQGHAAAQTALAEMYRDGEGVPRDLEEAARWYRKAAEQGERYAQDGLGRCYQYGWGVETNDTEAVKWYRMAAEQGSAAAQIDLGEMYRLGRGVQENFKEANAWFRKAVDLGSVKALTCLGELYARRYFAREWAVSSRETYLRLKRSIEELQRLTGKLSEEDSEQLKHADEEIQKPLPEHQPGDASEAVKWYRMAAERGDADAQRSLGSYYKQGLGIPADYAEAVKWYRRAANQGEALAQFDLAECFEAGTGTLQDFVEAYKWYNLACVENPFRAKKRDALAEKMTPQQIVEAQRRAKAFVAKKESSEGEGSPAPDATPPADLRPASSGTGFFVVDDGYLLTSAHVVEEAARIVVRAGGKQYPAKLVKADKANDVALLKVSGSFQALPIGASRGVKLGESVFTVGFPNTEIQGVEPKLTRGEISSLNGVQDDPREFQISVAVQPGNSGGPLVNQHGNVVGIIESRLADIATLKATGSLPQNVNYAVKSSFLLSFLESLPEISAKLKEPNTKERKFEDVVKEAEQAAVLVLVY